ncbi:hypothetical protein D3C87_1641530 [compost metagenome]
MGFPPVVDQRVVLVDHRGNDIRVDVVRLVDLEIDSQAGVTLDDCRNTDIREGLALVGFLIAQTMEGQRQLFEKYIGLDLNGLEAYG